MSVTDTDYFHGTDEDSAVSLIRDGIIEGALQARDRGFFGEGFYVTQMFGHATNYGQAVVEVEFPESVRVFPAHEMLEPGSSVRVETGASLPSWYTEFMTWYVDQVRDAAVWETVPSAEKDDVLSRARSEVNPSSPDFERHSTYDEVTEYAAAQGYDIVEWNDHENIVVDFDAPSDIVPANEQARDAARAAGVRE